MRLAALPGPAVLSSREECLLSSLQQFRGLPREMRTLIHLCAVGREASCPPCRALEPRLERIARQYEDRLPVYRVDIDRDMPIAERFGVKSIPTILVVRGGREVARLDGLITDRDLTAAFDREAG